MTDNKHFQRARLKTSSTDKHYSLDSKMTSAQVVETSCSHQRTTVTRTILLFTITAQILARSLANFYCQYADRHMNLWCLRCGNERERTIWQFVIVCEWRFDSLRSWRYCKRTRNNKVLTAEPISERRLRRQNFISHAPYGQLRRLTIWQFIIVCGSTRLSPRGSTATLIMLWRNSWSITGQTHEKLTSIC